MNVIDKIMLGQNKFLAIAEICNKYYLISITERNIEIIKELDEFKPQDETQIEPSIDFSKILDKFIKK